MNIHISKSTGIASTELSAFDNALFNAGIANYNLIYLSSVIPPRSIITVHENGIQSVAMPGEWGDRLYVVMAQNRTSVVGETVSAGIGWVQDPETKKGLFVEHEGHSEQEVKSLITHSLNDLMKTRGINFGDIHMQLNSIVCEDEPVCAMVVAMYQHEAWKV